MRMREKLKEKERKSLYIMCGGEGGVDSSYSFSFVFVVRVGVGVGLITLDSFSFSFSFFIFPTIPLDPTPKRGTDNFHFL
jgi:hypothetical protein